MKAFLRFNAVLIKNNLFVFIFLNLFTPVLLVGFLGTMKNNNIKSNTLKNPLSVHITDEDKTDLSLSFVNALQSEKLKTVMDYKDEKNPEYEIIIPKGYKTAAENNAEFDIIIREAKNAGSTAGILLASIIKNINTSLITNYNITKNMEDIAKQNADLYSELKTEYEALRQELIKPAANIKLYQAEFALSGYGVYAISYIILIIFTFAIQPAYNSYKKTDSAFKIRLASLPLKRGSLFTFKVAAQSVNVFVITLIYLLFFRILNIAFTQNIFLILLYALIVSFFCGSLAECLDCFRNKDAVIGSASILFFGGFIIMDIITPILKERYKSAYILAEYNLVNIIILPLKTLALKSSAFEIAKSFLFLFVMSFVFYICGLCITESKKR
ncbi:ABC transporter permease [Treponema pedis]|uniref:ABC transporter permease n=1 Tax=Treponema pedis TaxID=409322 RepID=UPI0004061C5A|nr:ABC transporter permease [Treponema pedis]